MLEQLLASSFTVIIMSVLLGVGSIFVGLAIVLMVHDVVRWLAVKAKSLLSDRRVLK